VRTAIVSDLHIGSASGEDLLRAPSMRELLLAELAGADRVVLLGDIVELRDLPLAEAMEAARPFFEELGNAVGEASVLLVPGNHDHRFAEPILDQVAIDGGPLGLEQRRAASGTAEPLAGWLGDARLEVAYPGAWLSDDVYATHGHYLDCHLTLPRLECLAAAAVMRVAGGLPDPATTDDYERILRPIYGLTFGLAQAGVSRRVTDRGRPADRAWRWMAGSGRLNWGRLVARGAFPAAVWGINRALRASFDADLSAESISRGGVAAGAELARRLGLGSAQVITGHTHRPGPRRSEWRIPGGGRLHNTGNWVFNPVLHRPGAGPGPYWPGTVTWLEDDTPPRRVSLLDDRDAEELGRLADGGRLRLTSLAAELE
jgi:predicted phosphodiesterase